MPPWLRKYPPYIAEPNFSDPSYPLFSTPQYSQSYSFIHTVSNSLQPSRLIMHRGWKTRARIGAPVLSLSPASSLFTLALAALSTRVSCTCSYCVRAIRDYSARPIRKRSRDSPRPKSYLRARVGNCAHRGAVIYCALRAGKFRDEENFCVAQIRRDNSRRCFEIPLRLRDEWSSIMMYDTSSIRKSIRRIIN